jgi:DNA topoisomerase I
MKKLVIVESPAKSRTITKYLSGKDDEYVVKSSLGHVRDLATSGPQGLGVDIAHDFKPNYIIDKDKYKVVKQLKKESEQSDEVILATDPDREGEAIAWHLAEILNLDVTKTKRLQFNEITRDSITKAIESPGTINMDMKASQEARRIIDRIFGFILSKLLQRKIKSRSAGRVQSVTLKMIVDREKEIEAFTPEEYWTIDGKLQYQNDVIDVDLVKVDGKKADIKNEQQANELNSRLTDQLVLTDIKKSNRKRQPRPPFTTSTLQQEAFSKFKFSTKRTNAIAQSLYEGIKIQGEEVGLITYMRTDSSRLAPDYIQRAHTYLLKHYDQKYLAGPRKGKLAPRAQDAHEAIRPTSNNRHPDTIKNELTEDQYKLYNLIYRRTLASLMAPLEEKVITYSFDHQGLIFQAEGVSVIFDGFTAINPYSNNKDEKEKQLPEVPLNSSLKIITMEPKQHFTKPPARYSEAKIVEAMEKNGIGRPSTYSSMIETLKKSEYITVKSGVITPTEEGRCTTEYLSTYFTNLLNPEFTSRMEKRLDEIQDGNNSNLELLKPFYEWLNRQIARAEKLPIPQACVIDHGPCPQCEKGRLVKKRSRYGSFIACNNYPECRYIVKKEEKPQETIDRLCPECGGALVIRSSKRKGQKFIGCSNYPKCRYIEKYKAKTDNDND